MKLDKKRLQIVMARRCIDKKLLAKRAGIAYITLIRSTETGKSKPSTIGKIARALGIDPADIIEGGAEQ